MPKLSENVCEDETRALATSVPCDLEMARERGAKRVRHYVSRAKAENTRRAYRGDVERFVTWARDVGEPFLPATPGALAWYLTTLADAGKSVSTIQRAAAAVGKAHDMAGHPSPTKSPEVRVVMDGIRREKGVRPRGKDPLLLGDVKRLVAVASVRDRALLLVGFFGALRRSELVGIDVEHLTFEDRGLRLLVAKSKTDQAGAGHVIGIPYRDAPTGGVCPVRALREHLDAEQIDTGPVFRNGSGRRLSAQTVARVVKRLASRVGLDPQRLGAHSLRAGYVTSAYLAGAREMEIRAVTRHQSADMTRRYTRIDDVYANASTLIE